MRSFNGRRMDGKPIDLPGTLSDKQPQHACHGVLIVSRQDLLGALHQLGAVLLRDGVGKIQLMSCLQESSVEIE